MDYFDLGPFSRTITTHSPGAQVWFDRGLNSRLIKQQLDQAMARAEVPVYASCYCRQQAAA